MDSIQKKRIYCFDLLKIISILIVFFHHIMMDLYIVHPMHNLKILETLIVRPNMNLGMIACGMFILLSGATLALKGKEEKPIEFYKKRLIRVLIPFYIAYIIYFVIKVITFKTIHFFNGVPKWRFIFTIMGMDEYLSANGIATFTIGVGEWFLGCIMLCYLVYPFLFKLHKKYKLLTFIFMTLYFIFINIFYNNFKFVIPSHMNFFCQIYNFYLGILLIGMVNEYREPLISEHFKNLFLKMRTIRGSIKGKPRITKLFEVPYNESGKKQKSKEKILLIICLIIILFFYFYLPMIFIPDNFKTSIVLVSLFITFYLMEDFISKIEFLKVFTVFFNKISLEIYLVHHFVIYQMDYMLAYARLSGIKTLVVIIADLLLTIILAIFVEKLSGKVTSFVYKSHK